MRLYVTRPWSDPGATRFIQIGAANACPFCQARQLRDFPPGTQVMLLCGHRAGMRAMILDRKDWHARTDQICIRSERQSRPGARIFALNNFLAIPDSVLVAPSWALPLAIDDSFKVDEAILTTMEGLQRNSSSKWANLMSAIETVWRWRLPVRGNDLFPAFAAHGLGARNEKRFAEFFDFGLELLIQTQGRAPIRRRRMPPLSKGTYEPVHRPPRLRELQAKLKAW